MPYSLNVTIILSILLIIGSIGAYFIIDRRVNAYLKTIHRSLLILIYALLSIAILAVVAFCFYIWGVDLNTMLLDFWDVLTTLFSEKIGAFISTLALILFSVFVTKLFKMMVARSQANIDVLNQKRKHTIIKITSSIVNYAVKIIVVLAILAVWGVNVLPALAGVGMLGLVVGLGAQDLIKDFIAGFFIVFEKHFDVGDTIEVNGFKGKVIDIGLKTTKVMNWKKDVKIFNNASVHNAINYSITESLAIVEFGVSYDADIDVVLNALKEELPKTREVIPEIIEDPVCLGVINFAASSVDLRVTARTLTEQHYGVERALRKEIKKILGVYGIEIPFTQIVLHNKKD